MEAQELRIGNAIEYNFDDGWKEIKVSSSDIRVLSGDLDIHPIKELNDKERLKYRPIPLTEEWEKKYGIKMWTLAGETWQRKFIDNIEIPQWIEHVHELQNWYYWKFKKTELEIK